MTLRLASCCIVLMCAASGCVFQPRPGATTLIGPEARSSAQPVPGKLTMGAGDAVGERLFAANATVGTPVLIQSASLDRD